MTTTTNDADGPQREGEALEEYVARLAECRGLSLFPSEDPADPGTYALVPDEIGLKVPLGPDTLEGLAGWLTRGQWDPERYRISTAHDRDPS